MAKALGVQTADVAATARAEIYPVGGSKCLAPFAIPTKFTWDDSCDCGTEKSLACGNGKLDVKTACEMNSIRVINFSKDDIGTQLTLKSGDPHETIAPGQYNPVDFPPLGKGRPETGGDAYRENLAGCDGSNDVLVTRGDNLQMEPGNMIGPTKQGVDNLIALDPGASWDFSNKSIVGSRYADPLGSPRVVIIAMFDPRYPPSSGRDYITVFQQAGVFVEG